VKHSNALMALLVMAIPAGAQKKADRKTLGNLQAHITYLASDKLEGRRTGTPGEQLAATYIAAQMKQTGLLPKGDSGYLQSFPVDEGRLVDEKTHLQVNKSTITAEQFIPLPFSAQKSAKGDVLKDVDEADNIWVINVKELDINPHADPLDIYRQNAKQAAESGATGVVFFNGPESIDEVKKWCSLTDVKAINIPVIWADKTLSKTLSTTEELHIEMTVAFANSKRRGINIIGFIDNKAPNTIVIGAHFDHLGHNEDHNGLGTGKNEIYNGADDNASGTAGLLELARELKDSRLRANNYLFVAFSGEELGLFGSKYFLEHSPVPAASMNYMINMDMIGRLDPQKGMQVGGIGTSPSFPALLKEVDPAGLTLTYDSSGVGPSDHTSFYHKNVPVLFFFTGAHADYHKPSDKPEKINYDGEIQVLHLVYDVVDKSNGMGKLAFTKTRDQQNNSSHFTVTLGIMPDYTWRKTGVRIDAISEGKTAQKAGLLASDVIIKLGPNSVTNLDDYMQALSTFKKGDHTTVIVKRGETEKTFEIQF
jgi:aminopeptidase YwaD